MNLGGPGASFKIAVRVAALLGVLGSISAQQAPPSQTPKSTTTPSVRTSDSSPDKRFDSYINNFDYEQLGDAIGGMPPSAQRNYFAGVLANRAGRINESIALLTTALPKLDAHRTTVALHSLADDYVKTYRYRDAIRAYEELLHNYPPQIEKSERQSAEDDYHTVLLLRDAPPQTISLDGPIDVATHRNPALGSIEADLTVNGIKESWLLDTGANFSTVSASFAKKLGVAVSAEAAQTKGLTGVENTLHVAVVPEVRIGTATVHNVVLLVVGDDSLKVPTGPSGAPFQIDAVLGYPVLQALKRITFTKNGHLLAGPGSPSAEGSAKLYMHELTPLLECKVENRKILFSFDTGANGTVFSDRYYREFPSQFKGLKKKPHSIFGAGGIKNMAAFYLPRVELGVGRTEAVLHNIPVIPAIGSDVDQLYGNLGRDLVDSYRSFTIDFENMRFSLNARQSTGD